MGRQGSQNKTVNGNGHNASEAAALPSQAGVPWLEYRHKVNANFT